MSLPVDHHSIFVDFKFLSENGLLFEINNEVLHRYGLALSYNPEDGTSCGAVVSDDLLFEYSEELKNAEKERLINFIQNRKEILTAVLERKTSTPTVDEK